MYICNTKIFSANRLVIKFFLCQKFCFLIRLNINSRQRDSKHGLGGAPEVRFHRQFEVLKVVIWYF